MKIVACSDLHLDKTTLGVPRMTEGARALRQAVDHAMKIEARWFFFLGDISDPDNGGSTFAAQGLAIEAIRSLTDANIYSIWLVGNHDIVEDGSGFNVLTPLKVLESMTLGFIADEPSKIHLGDNYHAVCLPYAPIARAYDPAKMAREFRYDREEKQIVLSHLMIPGIAPGEETLEMPRGRDIVLPLEETSHATMRLSGHYHKRQDFDPGDGGPPIHVVGTYPMTFGEETNQAAFSVITLP